MPYNKLEVYITKVGLTLGTITGVSMELENLDLILAIVLKGVSIISFAIVIILNFGKLIDKFKEWIS